jgi:hypothetical protein
MSFLIERQDVTTSDGTTPEGGVYITVKLNGAVATILNADGTAKANPFQSGVDGSFSYFVAVAGTYVEEYRFNLADTAREIIAVGLDGSADASASLAYQSAIEAEAAALDAGAASLSAGSAATVAQNVLSAIHTALGAGGSDVSLRANLADPASGANLVSYQRPSGVSQDVYHFIAREKCTPLEYGGVGDGSAFDTAALQAAVTSGKRVRLPVDFNFKTKGGILAPSYAQVEGDGGLITFDASVATYLFWLKGNISQFACMGARFTSTSDIGFMHFFRLEQAAGETADEIWIEENVNTYLPATGPGSGDRWFAAGAGDGTRQNLHINKNHTSGPMQLVASLVSSGTFKNSEVNYNFIENARTNAISFSSTGTIGSPCTLDTVDCIGNRIRATLYTSTGVFFGLDNSTADRNTHIKNLTLDNDIDISASPVKTAGYYGRLGNKCAGIGGFDSIADGILIGGKLRYGAFLFDQPTPSLSTLSQATNVIIDDLKSLNGDLIIQHCANETKIIGGTSTASSPVRPGANNGRVHSKGAVRGTFIPFTADAEFDWYADGDRFTGAASGTDWPIIVNANSGKHQTYTQYGGSVDSFTSGTKRAMIKTQGAGAPTAKLKRVGSSTTWALARTEAVTGTITDDGG